MMHGISKFTKLIWWSEKLFKSVRAIIDDVYFAMANLKKQPRSNFIATLLVQQSLQGGCQLSIKLSSHPGASAPYRGWGVSAPLPMRMGAHVCVTASHLLKVLI